MNHNPKIAVVVSHPIQHFCPQYVSFAKNSGVVFKVFFASMLGLKKYVDVGFKEEIAWSNLNIGQFDHEFLNGDAVIQSDKNLDAPSLENALSFYNPEIVIVYGYFQKLQRRSWRWARKNKVPLAYISDSELRQKRNKLKDMIKYPFLRKYFSAISYFLTVGDANEAFYEKHGVPCNKFIRMHFPIDIVAYSKAWENKEGLNRKIRLQYSIPANEAVLSVVGKLVSWKNQDHIIEALILLEQKGFFLHLFIIGSGEMMEKCQERAKVLRKSKVYFTGFVSPDELPSYYASTDIYIHPASKEPHSIAVSEAIYMGCPVIISDRCGSYGINDDVQAQKNGYVYSFGNINELADRILELAKDKEKRTAFGSYAHKTAVRFQQRSHFEIIEELRKMLLA